MSRTSLGLAVLLPACALTLAAQNGAAPNGKAPAPAASAPAPGQPKAFDEVVKGATRTDGFLPVWRKDDKLWIELRPELFGKPIFFTQYLSKGIGENQLYAGMMGHWGEGASNSYPATWRKVGQQVQLLALNTEFVAREGLPIARAVQDGFSMSLLASAPVASQPHPEHKSVLVDASALLLSDLPGGATALEALYRQPYVFDRTNSAFGPVQQAGDQTSFQLDAHYQLAKRILPPLLPPGAQAPPMAPLPQTVPDVRSLFLGYRLNFMPLPAEPMRARAMDDRVGYFATTLTDFSGDLQPDNRRQIIHRWRLEKADPAAALSRPKQPIVYWLDKNIPEKFRKVVADGILAWNKAFERIGFKDAIEVKVQPDNADWDTLDAKHASIRWLVGSDVAFAIGPSVVDPRTGEILDADIGMGEFWTRRWRGQWKDEIPSGASQHALTGGAGAVGARDLDEVAFGMDLLEARGDLDPDSPETEAFVLDFLKGIVTHEVGHTLGLRHNFRSSRLYTDAQLADPAFTRKNGMAGSIMDYTALNIAPKGQKQGDYVGTALGPYDYWAIEYGYAPIPPEKEAEELARIAGKGAKDPLLAYGTDPDAGYGTGAAEGMDPDVNRWDIGADTLGWAARRMQLSRELWERQQARFDQPGRSYDRERAVFLGSISEMARAANVAAKFVGGVTFAYDAPGSGGQRPLTPVSAARQREALRLLEQNLFQVESFRLKPAFVASLVPSNLNRREIAPDFNLANQVLGLQRRTLAQLFQPAVMNRILAAPDKLANPKEAFRLSELYEGLHAAVWSELRSGKDVGLMRRNLQREHVALLAGQVLRGGVPADARAFARQELRSLQAQLKASQAKPGFSREAKAHLADCLATVEEALKASLQRSSL